MDQKTFLDNFGVIADAPNGIVQLREVVLSLAISGSLTSSKVDSWKKTTLGNEVEIVRGITFPASAKNRTPMPGLVACLRTANVQSEVDWDDLLYVSEDYVRKPEQFIQLNDLLISMANSRELVVKVALVRDLNMHCTLGGFIAAIRCKSELLPKFLMSVLRIPKSREQLIDSSTQTTNIANISLGRLRPFELLLPPLDEQERIVAKVDELMALCDELEAEKTKQETLRTAARASAIDAISTATTSEELSAAWSRISINWETVVDSPESIGKLRQLIVSFAVKGLLTLQGEIPDSEHVEPFESSTKLDESKLWLSSSVLAEIPRGWRRTPMGTLGKWGSGGTPTSTRKEFYTNGTIAWAVIGDLNEGELWVTEKSITDKALVESSATMIPKGSVLIAMYGASIGKTAITAIECTSNQAIAHCSPGPQISGEYLLLLAKSLKSELIDSGQGAAQPNISQTVIKHLLVDVPPLRIQREIVEKVEELMTHCDALDTNLNLRTEIESAFAGASSQLLIV